MKTGNLIENGAELKRIMAREIELAGQKRGSKASGLLDTAVDFDLRRIGARPSIQS